MFNTDAESALLGVGLLSPSSCLHAPGKRRGEERLPSKRPPIKTFKMNNQNGRRLRLKLNGIAAPSTWTLRWVDGWGSLYIYQTRTGSNVKLASSWSTRKHTLRHVTILIKTSSHIISMGATSYQKNTPPLPNKANLCSAKQFLSFPFACVQIHKSQGKTQVCLFLYPIPEMSLLIVLSKGKADVLCLFGPAVGYY